MEQLASPARGRPCWASREASIFLVVGATGLVGGEICRRLAATGASVRALVRATSDPAKVRLLREAGVEVVEGDLRNPASLTAACQGVDALVSTVSAMPFSYVPGVNDITTTDTIGMRNLLDAAISTGVKRFVYTSFSENLDLDLTLRNAKREVERWVMDSGLEYTILRPSCFMEVWLSPAVGFDPANGTATIYGHGEHPISWIAASDVARFAIVALASPATLNAVLELGGPLPLTPLEVVGIFEAVVGRKLELTFVPAEALTAQQEQATDPMQQSFTGLMRCYAAGDPIEMGRTAMLLPEPLTTVEAFATASVPVTANG